MSDEHTIYTGIIKHSLMRKSLRKRKVVVKYECDTKIRHRGTGRRIVKKRDTDDNPLKRKHIHGNVISERQVRNEVRKRLSPMIESLQEAKRKTNSAQKTILKLKKKLRNRNEKLICSTNRIDDLSKVSDEFDLCYFKIFFTDLHFHAHTRNFVRAERNYNTRIMNLSYTLKTLIVSNKS